MKLDKIDTQIVNTLIEYSNSNLSPSMREIQKNTNCQSLSTIHKHCNSLAEKGILEKTDNQKRTIKLANTKSRTIPLVNFDKYCEDFMNIDCILGFISWTPDRDEYEYPLFAVKATDDYNDIIHKNDIVIAENTFKDGKNYYIEEKQNKLYFTDKHSLKCIGRIISVIKYM